jgi:hypothetical protein
MAGGFDAADLINMFVRHDQSSFRGIFAASFAEVLAPGSKVKTTTPTKNRVIARRPQLSAK